MSAGCEDTLSTQKFFSIGIKVDMEFIITCPDTCETKPGNVFGQDNYADDSNICKAAFHSGALTEKGNYY